MKYAVAFGILGLLAGAVGIIAYLKIDAYIPRKKLPDSRHIAL